MIHRIIFLTFILNIIIIINGKNCINKIIPKEIEHGILNMDNWQGNDCHEYYINITDYNLYEENIFEISTTKEIDIIRQGEIYTLITNLTIDEIRNYSIIPKDLYIKQNNSYKIDPLTGDTYFYMPFQKTSFNQKYFIILISPNLSSNEIVFYSISKRIPIIKIKENEDKIFSHILNSTNDTHLFYKFELDKNINLTKNNLFVFADDISKSIFITNLTSLISYNSKMLVIEKNSSNITEFFVGIKNREKKKINITIKFYENDFYYLNGNERLNQKIYFEHLNCNNKYYIIENYYNSNDNLKKYLIINRFYGNFSLKYYNSIRNINFEEYEIKENGIEILNEIEIIKGSLNIFILNCKTPSSFTFEFFSDDVKANLLEGEQFKTYLYPNTNYYKINLNLLNEKNNKYLFYLSIFDIKNETSLNYIFDSDRYKNQIKLENPKLNITEIIYNDIEDNIQIRLNADNGAFIYYYLTSNRLFYNIVEGETFITDKSKSNLALKIKKDYNFDYITFEAESEYEKMNLNYELKILNVENIDNNRILAPLPEINKKSETNKINFHISNPYNKFDSSIDDDNYFYLLINFPNIYQYPIYVNIKYIYNKNIISLKQNEYEIIKLENEYEIYGDKNYLLKNKIFFNINKCDYSKNYSFTNYYENIKNIIIQNNIIYNREKYLTDNLYCNSKFIIKKERNEKNEEYFYPSNYYNKGDIYLNYFLVNEQMYNTIDITNDFSIKYKDKMRKTTNLYWNEYIIKNKNQHILTNYSIYILPKESPVNTICQLSLIPSNISILNLTNIDINIEEGNYKIAIVASVIDKEFPIITMYDILNLNVSKRINIIFIAFLILIVLSIIVIILYFYYRKKRKFICFKRKEVMFSSQIEENKLIENKNNDEIDALNKERINKNHNERENKNYSKDKKSVNDTESYDENED